MCVPVCSYEYVENDMCEHTGGVNMGMYECADEHVCVWGGKAIMHVCICLSLKGRVCLCMCFIFFFVLK